MKLNHSWINRKGIVHSRDDGDGAGAGMCLPVTSDASNKLPARAA